VNGDALILFLTSYEASHTDIGIQNKYLPFVPTHHWHIIETGNDGYRFKNSTSNKERKTWK